MSYFIWYSIGRFFIEALRTDSLWVPSASMGGFSRKWNVVSNDGNGLEQGYLRSSVW